MLGPEWRATQQEAQLAAEQICTGITALGRANYAQKGYYTQAFFGLSIGLERMGKLIFIADYAIQQHGAYPADATLRKISHNVLSLLSECEKISQRLDPKRHFPTRPNGQIHQAIEEIISLFATRLRYYNLDYLTGKGENRQDPMRLWWEKVAIPICAKHYSKRQQEKDEAVGRTLEGDLGNMCLIRQATEDNNAIGDLFSAYTQSRVALTVQKYGRLYTLQIVRWLTSILFELSHEGAYKHNISSLAGLNEPFVMFFNDDPFLLRRKTWSIYRL